MSLAQIHVDAMASTAAFTDQGQQPPGVDGDAHAGGVSDTPARFLVPADRTLSLGYAAHGNGVALPAVKAKDAVGLSDHHPTFHVCHFPAALLPLADVGPIEGCGKGGELFRREATGLSRLGLKGLRSHA